MIPFILTVHLRLKWSILNPSNLTLQILFFSRCSLRVQKYSMCDGLSLTSLLRVVQIPAQRQRCSKATSNFVAQPHSAVCTMPAVHVTLELASNTVFQFLQNSTRCKHIRVVFMLLLRELPVKHPQLILRKKKGWLLTQLKQMLLYSTAGIVNVLCDKGRKTVSACVCAWSVCVWAFSVFWMWAGMDWVCFCLDW